MKIRPTKTTFRPLAPLFLACLTITNAGCSHTPQPRNQTPHWVHHPVSKGLVCTQTKGIYALAKAEELAIHHCILQLSKKRISGQSEVTKSTQVYQNQYGERVQTTASAVDHFQVKNAQEGDIAYDVLGKYYDAATETVSVWIKLNR